MTIYSPQQLPVSLGSTPLTAPQYTSAITVACMKLPVGTSGTLEPSAKMGCPLALSADGDLNSPGALLHLNYE